MERVARVQRRLGLDQVAGEEDLVLGQPGDDVALGVPAAEELQHQLAAVTTELDGELVAEGHGRPGEAGDGLGLLEQPRHPAVLALPVLLAALGDEVLGLLGADDDLGVEGARAEHADGVVVAEHQVADRLVGVLAQLGQPPAGGHRGGHGLEADEEVLALDRTEVGVALGGQRIDAVGEDLEGLLLDAQIGGGSEGLGCHEGSPVGCVL